MPSRASFGVAMTCTARYAGFLVASVASLRRYNTTVPVRVLADPEGAAVLAPIAGGLGIDLVPMDPSWQAGAGATGEDDEQVRSRLMKLHAVANADFDPFLYLDCDTLVLDDIGLLADELGPALATGTDLYSLLRRPVAPTLWGDRRLYFPDAAVTRQGAVDVIDKVYGVRLPVAGLDELVCWNSGIIAGRPAAMRRIGEQWLRLYRRMLASPHRSAIVPRDQLGFWLSLWSQRRQVRVAEMPARWNFMAAQLLGLPPGTEELDDERLDGVAILHLAGYKFEPWALRRVMPVLRSVPGAPELEIPAGALPVW